MAGFTPQEQSNLLAGALDFYIRSPAFSQVIQKRPLLDALWSKKKTYSGGLGAIKRNVKGQYTTTIQGFQNTDTVSYGNPANMVQASYTDRELHAGISYSYQEAHRDGISITDGVETQHSGASVTRISGIIEDKMEDLTEGWARSMNAMLWNDGTADPLLIPGITSIITETPNVGTTGGLNRATLNWWRNRALLAIASNLTVADQQPLVRAMRREIRQLRRFQGGEPNLILAGADFITALEDELTAKMNYSLEGLGNKSTEVTAGTIMLSGLPVMYDPTLDDISKSKYAYIIDTKNICLYTMEGEDKKTHHPHRHPEVYADYHALTTVGAMTAWMLRSSCVMSIA